MLRVSRNRIWYKFLNIIYQEVFIFININYIFIKAYYPPDQSCIKCSDIDPYCTECVYD